MTRYDISEWCDFVRGLADTDAERQMREHLASGNPGAQRMVDVLRRVHEVAQADQEMAIPDYAVRMAKAIGSVQRPREEVPSSSLWRLLPFHLTFDSSSQPALAGMRDMQASIRQLSFKSEGFTVDVRMEPDADPTHTVVVGQVLDTSNGPSPVAEVPVLLVAGGQIVDSAVTSRFGEFQAEGLPQDQLDLYVLVDSKSCIRLPLEQDAE